MPYVPPGTSRLELNIPHELLAHLQTSANKNHRNMSSEAIALIERGLASQKRASAQQRAHRLPADFAVTKEMVAWARAECPEVDGKEQTAQFIDYWSSAAGRGATKLDWVAAWRNWMRKNRDSIRQRSQPRASTTDQRVAAARALADKYRSRGE